MRAQVTTVEASPARLDDAIRFFREQVLPRLRQMDGFEEFIVLSARRSGKLLGVALWESEEALRATAEDDSGGSGAANAARSRAADAAGGTVASVEHYEVSLSTRRPQRAVGRGHGHGRRGDGHGGRGHRHPPGGGEKKS